MGYWTNAPHVIKFVDDLVEQWHTDTDVTVSLIEYLHLTEDEFLSWIKDPTDLPKDYLTRFDKTDYETS